MTITRKQIDRMRTDSRLGIDVQLEEFIIAQYGQEPDGPEYTEQDLHEQIRNLIYRYNQQNPVHAQTEDLSKPWDLTATQTSPIATEKELIAKTNP